MFFNKFLSIFIAIVYIVAPALAASPTPLTVQTFKTNNYAVAPGDLTVNFTACDPVNGNSFAPSGREVLIAVNSDATAAHTFTVDSLPDEFGRFDTSLTNYSVAANSTSAIQLKYLTGWSNGLITLGCSDAHILFAVLHFQ